MLKRLLLGFMAFLVVGSLVMAATGCKDDPPMPIPIPEPGEPKD